MTEILERIQDIAQRYNKLGVVKNGTLASISAAVEARNSPEARLMTRDHTKDLQNPDR